MPHFKVGGELDDVQVLGQWNFTLQADTPLYWLKSGPLDFYLLKFRVASFNPSTWGIVFHAEQDASGLDGVSFWAERRPDAGALAKAGTGEAMCSTKRYVVSGDGLDMPPVVTRSFEDALGRTTESVEVLVQGYKGCVFLQDRQIQIKFRTKLGKGSIAFFNSSQAETNDDVHFSQMTITAMRRGPLEVDGILSRRERVLLGVERPNPRNRGEYLEVVRQEEETAVADELSPDAPVHVAAGGAHMGVSPGKGTTCSTAFPSPTQTKQRFTGLSSMKKTMASHSSQDTVSSSPGLRSTAPVRGSSGARSKGVTAMAQTAEASQTWGGSSQSALRRSPQSRLRQSASDSVLRKTAGTMCGQSSSTSLQATKGSRGGYDMVPCGINAPSREQQFMKNVFWREFENRKPGACAEFIPM